MKRISWSHFFVRWFYGYCYSYRYRLFFHTSHGNHHSSSNLKKVTKIPPDPVLILFAFDPWTHGQLSIRKSIVFYLSNYGSHCHALSKTQQKASNIPPISNRYSTTEQIHHISFTNFPRRLLSFNPSQRKTRTRTTTSCVELSESYWPMKTNMYVFFLLQQTLNTALGKQ